MTTPTISVKRSSYLPTLGDFTPSIPSTLTCIVPPTVPVVDDLSSALTGLALATDPSPPSSTGTEGPSPRFNGPPVDFAPVNSPRPRPPVGIPSNFYIKIKHTLDVSSWSIYDVYSAYAYFPGQASAGRMMACITASALVQDSDIAAKVLRDANAYVTLGPLQGSRVPRFYGLWRAEVPNEHQEGRPPVEMFMILLEDVLSPSLTITDLLDLPRGPSKYGPHILAAVSDMATAGVFPCGPSAVSSGDNRTPIKIRFFDFHNAKLRTENDNWESDVATALQALRHRLQVAAGEVEDDDQWEEAEDFDEFAEDVDMRDVVMA